MGPVVSCWSPVQVELHPWWPQSALRKRLAGQRASSGQSQKAGSEVGWRQNDQGSGDFG